MTSGFGRRSFLLVIDHFPGVPYHFPLTILCWEIAIFDKTMVQLAAAVVLLPCPPVRELPEGKLFVNN